MYNGMIAPVKPFAIRGAIWYQGESNVGNGLKYADKMQALVEGWRHVWGYDFPFYFVQIAPFAGYGRGSLPPLWEAQVASLKIPGTGMAVTTDLVADISTSIPRTRSKWATAWPSGRWRRTTASRPCVLGAALQGDEGRGQQDPAYVRPRRRRAEVA